MKTAPLLLLALLLCAVLTAATPPALVNYQGVLRDAGGAPRTGEFDMAFRFYDQDAGGTLLLTDTHDAGSPSGRVPVTNGLFTAQVGAGTITAGSVPGLAEAFRDHAEVWLEVQVGTETLSPRLRVVASAYAQNAGALDGNGASAFAGAGHSQFSSAGGTGIDTSAAPAGSMLSTSATGTWSALAPGLSDQLLQSTGAGIQWTDPSVLNDGDWTIDGTDLHPAVSGNVGIGTRTPPSKLSIRGSMVVDVPSRDDTDQKQLSSNKSLLGFVNTWQSFTPAIGGRLIQWSQFMTTPWGMSSTLSIYEGEGTGGQLLTSQIVAPPQGGPSWFDFPISAPPELKAGNRYTVRLDPSNLCGLRVQDGDPYARGRFSSNPDYDARFIAHVQTNRAVLTTTSLGDVGIGTDTPSAKMDVQGTVHLFGAWQARVPGTTYTAETDGLVVGRIIKGVNGDRGCIHGYAAAVHRVSACMHEYDGADTIIPRNSFTMPVRKGETYSAVMDVTWGTPTFEAYWVPFGHGAGGARPAEGAPLPPPPTPEAAAAGMDPFGPQWEAMDGEESAPRFAVVALEPDHPLIHSFPMKDAVEPGEVLVMDPAGGEPLARCGRAEEPMVIGIATTGSGGGRAAVAVSGITLVKADATLAPIAKGDLLVTSGNPGHAMKAQPRIIDGEPIYRNGTVLGKALEDLPAETGMIRVLVMLR